MTIREIFTRDVATCTPLTPLQRVVELMIERDCGFMPVMDPDGSVSGVITDRDICLTLASHRRTAANVTAEEAMKHPVFSCFVDDDVATALATMRAHRVRRLPVVNRATRLQGVVSMDDLIIGTTEKDKPIVEDIVKTLRVIYGHRAADLVAK
jgi:CBS domain-containing protein